MEEAHKKWLIIIVSLLILIGFFFLAKSISPAFLSDLGLKTPLPIFTIIIGLLDGFNPCTIFILTLLLGLMISVSNSRQRILAVGFSFVFVVFIIYFLFMLAWLNIFKLIGFTTPFRIVIAAVAIIAGLINCKELFFFKKGITLMIQESHKVYLFRYMEKMKEIIIKGSIPALILSTVLLAIFSSIIEIPCTAGFPIIYTGVLTGKVGMAGISYFLYLFLYNLMYVLPLSIVIILLSYTFKEAHISKSQMQILKFIGGFIMILLGIILLVNPALLQ